MSDPTNPCPIPSEDRCPLCPGTCKPVSGDGRKGSKVFLIGEGPGPAEDSQGIPFIGPTGQELDSTYLPLAGLDREDVYVTNIVKCRTVGRALNYELVDACALWHLKGELEAVKPEHVVLMGRWANQLIDKGDDALGIERIHGRTIWAGLFETLYAVTSTLHPAAGLHKTQRMREIIEDFEALGRAIADPQKEIDSWPVDSIQQYSFTDNWLPSNYDASLVEGKLVGVDTELLGKNQFTDPIHCLTFSTAKNNGFYIARHQRHLLRAFHASIQDATVVFQKAEFDLPVCHRLA